MILINYYRVLIFIETSVTSFKFLVINKIELIIRTTYFTWAYQLIFKKRLQNYSSILNLNQPSHILELILIQEISKKKHIIKTLELNDIKYHYYKFNENEQRLIFKSEDAKKNGFISVQLRTNLLNINDTLLNNFSLINTLYKSRVLLIYLEKYKGEQITLQSLTNDIIIQVLETLHNFSNIMNTTIPIDSINRNYTTSRLYSKLLISKINRLLRENSFLESRKIFTQKKTLSPKTVKLSICHCDCNPSNILLHDNRINLIDTISSISISLKGFDVAYFLSFLGVERTILLLNGHYKLLINQYLGDSKLVLIYYLLIHSKNSISDNKIFELIDILF